MHELIKDLLLKKLDNPVLKELSDSALIKSGHRVAFTTDSFVVNPLNFPGGDIGKLAVCGTVNDLVVCGAEPEYLSLAFIIEEGLDYSVLEKITGSISLQARESGVSVVTGDIKVVEKGACDKIFINTSGLGKIVTKRALSVKNISSGDKIIITGNIGQHGMAVLSSREGLDLGFSIKSDCQSLRGLLLPIVKKTDCIKFMRDPTRGGVATTLNEIAEAAGVGIVIEEESMPISQKVRAAAELLGLDPFYIANEGCAILVVEGMSAKKILTLLKKHPLGSKAQIIGSVVRKPKSRVILNTILDTRRIIDMLTGEPLPRIC